MIYSRGTCMGTASTFSRETALQLAATQASSTGIAWRLPNVKELYSINTKSLNYPSIDPTAFPATPEHWFWSATPYVTNLSFGWFVDFGSGDINEAFLGFSYYVRLVRDGP